MTDSPDTLPDHIAFDEEGYLCDYTIWNEELAEAIAADLGVTLTAKCWQAVTAAREDFLQSQKSPSRRKLVKALGITSQELFELFPSSPMRTICKIAGLPKPLNCL